MDRRAFLAGMGALGATPAIGLTPTQHAVLLGQGGSFLPQALALFARFTTPPTLLRKTQINTLIGSLISAGVWGKLDGLYLMAAADSQAARLNWVQNAYNLIPVNSPAFTADRGYAGDGSTSYLNTNFVPATAGGHYAQDSAHLLVVDRTARAANNFAQLGCIDAVSSHIRTRLTGDFFLGNVNEATNAVITNTNSDGRFITNRVDASTVRLYRNGSLLGTASVASNGLNTHSFFICGVSSASGTLFLPSSDQLSCAGFGASLSPSEAAAYDAALSTYLSAVGAN